MTYMDKNEGMALYGINSYVWKLLRVNLGWQLSDYNGTVPVIPSAQQPELMEGTKQKPFLVYGAALQPTGNLPALEQESVAYNIYAKTSTEVNKIVNLLKDALDRKDDSARDINDWLHVEAAGRNYSRNVSYQSTSIALSEKASPAEQEGGWVSGFVLLNTSFISFAEEPKTTGFTYP